MLWIIFYFSSYSTVMPYWIKNSEYLTIYICNGLTCLLYKEVKRAYSPQTIINFNMMSSYTPVQIMNSVVPPPSKDFTFLKKKRLFYLNDRGKKTLLPLLLHFQRIACCWHQQAWGLVCQRYTSLTRLFVRPPRNKELTRKKWVNKSKSNVYATVPQ